MKIPENVKILMQRLIDNGYEAYIVGGAVRDYYLGVEPHDYDIFTNCKELLKIFPEGNVIGGEERQNKILTIIVDDIEISSYRSSGDRKLLGETLEQHQATCDFTINSIACDIDGSTDFFIDGKPNKFNSKGKDDLYKRILRFVGNPDDRIKEDPLRVLRGIRFKIKYYLSYDKNTKEAILKADISSLTKERIRDELIKILCLNNIKYADIAELEKVLLVKLFHENMFKSGGEHHNEVPYEHSVYSFQEASKITDDWRIRLAALLHDIGKAVARTEEGGEVHFYQHETKGAEIVEKWMTHMKFSKDEIKYVTEMIHLHMFGYKEEIKDKTYIKFFNKLEAAGIDIHDYIMLIYSDHQGNQAKPRIKFGDFLKGNYLYNNWLRIREQKTPFNISDLSIGGKDLIERYNMNPGPLIGKILNAVLEKIIDGDLRNERAEIFNWIEETKELANCIAKKIDEEVIEKIAKGELK